MFQSFACRDYRHSSLLYDNYLKIASIVYIRDFCGRLVPKCPRGDRLVISLVGLVWQCGWGGMWSAACMGRRRILAGYATTLIQQTSNRVTTSGAFNWGGCSTRGGGGEGYRYGSAFVQQLLEYRRYATVEYSAPNNHLTTQVTERYSQGHIYC